MSWLSEEEAIVSNALGGKISWSAAASQTEALGLKIEKSIASFAGSQATVIASQVVTTIKTDVSNAIATAETLMGPEISVSAAAAETLLDGLIVSGLGSVGAGAAAPIATKVANDAITGFAADLTSAINARAAQAQAKLIPPAS